MLGRHCPKFGHTKTVRARLRAEAAAARLTARAQVAVPLPRPVGFVAGDEYKLALAFDGDRFLTPWLPVLGKRAPEVPLLQVELVRLAARAHSRRAALTRAGADAHGGLPQRGARHITGGACVVPARARGAHPGAPRAQLPARPPAHAPRAQEFRNSSHWPKHVLVHYSWREVSEVDSVAGLYVLFLAGARSPRPHDCCLRSRHPRRPRAVVRRAGQRDAGERTAAAALLR